LQQNVDAGTIHKMICTMSTAETCEKNSLLCSKNAS